MEPPLTVGAVMTRNPFTVSPDAEFKDIATLLARERISAVPVVDGDVPIGVVSEADLLSNHEGVGGPSESGGWWARHDRHIFGHTAGHSAAHAAHAAHRGGHRAAGGAAAEVGHGGGVICARDLMTVPARTVDIGMTVSAAARELAITGLRRLFVLDHGKLVGVVSRRDVLDVFLRPDRDVQREIEDEVFGRVLRADPGTFTVAVDRGVVTVLGRMERRSAVTAAGRLIALVPGVVGILNRLDYVWDDEGA